MEFQDLSRVLALAVLASCSDSTAPEPATGSDLVFEGYLTSTPELLAYDSSTAQVRRLLALGAVVMDPEPSPDGSKIAFVVANYTEGTGDIFIMSRDGTGVTQLTFDSELDDQPTWSPDGTRIAYASNEGGTFDIWTMNPNGSAKQRLSSSVDLDAEPAWSPDGTAIAFRRSFFGGGSDLFIVSPTGGEARQLTLAGDQRLPVWTPDGARLVFVSQTSVSARPDLYSMTPVGGDVRPLVTDEVAGGCINPAFLKRPIE